MSYKVAKAGYFNSLESEAELRNLDSLWKRDVCERLQKRVELLSGKFSNRITAIEKQAEIQQKRKVYLIGQSLKTCVQCLKQ